MTFISAFVSHSNHFWYTDFHFPARECSAGLLDLLEDSIHIVDVLPNETAYAWVFDEDLIESAVWAWRTDNRMGLVGRVRKGHRSIPPALSGLITSGRALDIDVVHESCCHVRHLILQD